MILKVRLRRVVIRRRSMKEQRFHLCDIVNVHLTLDIHLTLSSLSDHTKEVVLSSH